MNNNAFRPCGWLVFTAAFLGGWAGTSSLAQSPPPQVTSDPLQLKPELKAALNSAWATKANWSGKAREVCAGANATKEQMEEAEAGAAEVTVVVNGQNALLTPTKAGGQLASVVVDESGDWMRAGDGLAQHTTPSAALLWNLPMLLPTPATFRIIDVATEDKWESITKSKVDDFTVEYVIKTVVIRGGYGEYAFRFQRSKTSSLLTGSAWRIFQLREGAPAEKVVEVEFSAREFAEVGGIRIPVAIDRRAMLKDATGKIRSNQVCRLKITEVAEMSADAAATLIAKACAPRAGETVAIEARKLRMVIGESWIEVAGVHFETAEPIQSIPTPTELESILRTARRSEGQASDPSSKSSN